MHTERTFMDMHAESPLPKSSTTLKTVSILATYGGFVLLYFLVQFHVITSRWLYIVLGYQAALVAGALWLILSLRRSELKMVTKSFMGTLTIFILLFFAASLASNVRIQARFCPADVDGFRSFAVVTEDNVSISGIARVESHDRAVIIVHGGAASMVDCQLLTLARELSKQFDVYLFDLRGYGQSKGESTFGYLEILDLKAVLDFTLHRNYSSVGVVGNSMGGMIAIRLVAQDKRVGALVTAGTPANFVDPKGGEAQMLMLVINNSLGRKIYQIFTQIPVSDSIAQVATTERSSVSPINVIYEISPTPLLIIHGKKDRNVSVENAYLLFSQAYQPKELIVYENGGHGITDLSREPGEPFRQTISDWLDKNLK